MLRLAFAFLVVGFVAGFFGYAGVALVSLGAARALFAICVVGFVVTVAWLVSHPTPVA